MKNINYVFLSIFFRKKKINGSVVVITAISIFVLVGIAALAIDVGYLYATRAETQNAADAASLAGARELAQIYKDYRDGGSIDNTMIKKIDGKLVIQQDGFDAILASVTTTAASNKAAKENILIDPIDVKIGNWDPTKFENEKERDVGTPQYDEDGNVVSIIPLDPLDPADQNLIQPDAVRVIARRSGIGLFFANIFNIATSDVSSKKAIAALSGPGHVIEGTANTPFGLASSLFPDKCKDYVTFYPTTDSCGGWHSFLFNEGIDEKIFNIIKGHNFEGNLPNGEKALSGEEWLKKNWDINKEPDAEISPAITAGETVFDFKNGTDASLFTGPNLDPNSYNGNAGKVIKNGAKSPLEDKDYLYDSRTETPKKNTTPAAFTAMFDYFRYRDGDDKPSVWTTFTPIYLDESGVGNCIAPAKELIVGFAQIEIKMPNPPPDKTIKVYLPCEPVVLPDRGSGLGAYGNLYGLIPNLVK